MFIWRIVHDEEVEEWDRGTVKQADGASRVVRMGRMIWKRNIDMV